MDRESSESSEQFAVQIDDHLRVDGLALVVREWHIKAAGAESHS
jgi:hypothetical protein